MKCWCGQVKAIEYNLAAIPKPLALPVQSWRPRKYAVLLPSSSISVKILYVRGVSPRSTRFAYDFCGFLKSRRTGAGKRALDSGSRWRDGTLLRDTHPSLVYSRVCVPAGGVLPWGLSDTLDRFFHGDLRQFLDLGSRRRRNCITFDDFFDKKI
jgi:hypothetical protein